MRLFTFIILFVLHNSLVLAKDNTGNGLKEVSTCIACHKEKNGNPMFPSLTGQKEKYLENELKAYRSHDRATKEAKNYMWGMVANLTDDNIKEMAQYFSNLTPAEVKPKESDEIALGKDIYLNGIPAKDIQSCSECHGQDGEGMGSMPKLSGQYVNYLVKQLQDFKSNTRHEAAHKMPNLVKNLTTADMKALAAFLSNK